MFITLALALLLPVEGDAVKLKVGERGPGLLPARIDRKDHRACRSFKGKKKVVLAFYPKAFTGG